MSGNRLSRRAFAQLFLGAPVALAASTLPKHAGLARGGIVNGKAGPVLDPLFAMTREAGAELILPLRRRGGCLLTMRFHYGEPRS